MFFLFFHYVRKYPTDVLKILKQILLLTGNAHNPTEQHFSYREKVFLQSLEPVCTRGLIRKFRKKKRWLKRHSNSTGDLLLKFHNRKERLLLPTTHRLFIKPVQLLQVIIKMLRLLSFLCLRSTCGIPQVSRLTVLNTDAQRFGQSHL